MVPITPPEMPLDPITAGAIQGGSSIIGSIIGGIGARSREKRAHRRAVDFWNMQNAYNSPKAQMRRMKEAGLNPALMYQKGNTGIASPLPQVRQEQPEIKTDLPALQTLLLTQQMKSTQIQDSLVKAQEDQVRENTQLARDKFEFDKQKWNDQEGSRELVDEGRRLDNYYQQMKNNRYPEQYAIEKAQNLVDIENGLLEASEKRLDIEELEYWAYLRKEYDIVKGDGALARHLAKLYKNDPAGIVSKLERMSKQGVDWLGKALEADAESYINETKSRFDKVDVTRPYRKYDPNNPMSIIELLKVFQ
jgi:hypothetical protein